ncbi:hypothetical protein [Thermus thermamylovorans]|uniref:Glycosyltransferase RgtA/B/C/D-like domain-containing protein n=1 Tax=Thermus thermamylovorans TaxID=2509362 RepID=A0A4Q9B704_9DEIN|nr:hypothetical protein [Thermus thermamylovorans]TBH21914.1 hypothetical protein ETP66_01350 [Thermus thermamylovorans]
MYSRQGVAFLNMLLGVWLVPIAAAYVAVGGFKVRGAGHRLFWFSAAVVALYPAPFWFTLDIYRDVFMLSIFLIGVYVARRYFSKATLARVGYAALFAVLVGVLFHLRGYLGFSLGLGFLLAHLFSRFRLRWEAIFAGLVLYGMALYVAHTVGLLAPVAQYRGEEGFAGGGSSFGLGFQGRSGMDFLRVFGLSFVYQVLGLYLNSFKAFLLFLAESLPFLYFAAGVWGARLRLDFFSKFLLLFALAYTTVFVLGNDNLGTAMRLRIFVYLAVFMVWARAQAQRSAVGWASFPSTTGREALGT